MSHPASLHHDVGGFALGKEAKKTRATEAMGFLHLPRAVRDGELEDVLCNIHGNRRMLHFRTPLCYWFNETVYDLALRCRSSRGRSPSHHCSGRSAPALLENSMGLAPLAAERPCLAGRRIPPSKAQARRRCE